MTRSPENSLRDILSFIQESNARLDKGQEVVLAGLEERLEQFNTQVLSMNRDQAVLQKTNLERVFKELERLQKRLVEQHELMRDQIENLSVRQKAMSAYMKPKG